MKWDIFISHASEDKVDVARPLAKMLQENGLRVWLDEHELFLGDSLRQRIDEGLAQSSWGLIVLSPNFLEKEWPQAELDALVSRELNDQRVILPVWHKISAKELLNKSPILASRLGIDTSKGLEAVCQSVIRAVQRRSVTSEIQNCPSESTIQDYWFKLPLYQIHSLLTEQKTFLDQMIGQYILKDFIGMGGTGAVFRAINASLGRIVALKLFYPLGGNYEVITKATERAVRGLSFVSNPGIVNLLDLGFMSGKHGKATYLVYDFIDGRELDDWSWSIDGDENATARRLNVTCQIATALKAAHNYEFVGNLGFQEIGVLHGDIKPANILVKALNDQPIVLDFMLPDIERLLKERPPRRGSYWEKDNDGKYWYHLPHTEEFGTPGFMPPEQEIDGIVSPASDIYALGMTLPHLFWPSRDAMVRTLSVESAYRGDRGKLEQELAKLIKAMTAAQPSSRIQKMDIVIAKIEQLKRLLD